MICGTFTPLERRHSVKINARKVDKFSMFLRQRVPFPNHSLDSRLTDFGQGKNAYKLCLRRNSTLILVTASPVIAFDNSQIKVEFTAGYKDPFITFQPYVTVVKQ